MYAGVAAGGPDTRLDLDRVIIRATEDRPGSEAGLGHGLEIVDGAVLDARSLIVSSNRVMGARLQDQGSSAVVRDSVIRDTRANANGGGGGTGIRAERGSSLELSATLVSGNRAAGLIADDEDTTLVIRDVVVRETLEEASSGDFGRGMLAHDGASVVAETLLLEHNREGGITADGAGTVVRLSDVVVRDTLLRETDGQGGVGLQLTGGVSLEVDSLVVADNRSIGLVAAGAGTTVTLRDTTVQDTDATANGEFGGGLSVANGAVLDATGVLVSGNREVGVLGLGAGTGIVLRDAVIRGTQERDCVDRVPGPCPPAGHAVSAGGGARVSLTRFVVADNAFAGIQMVRGAEVYGDTGIVTRNAIGINVQVPGFEIDAAFDDVRLVDNLRDLATDELPVPGAFDGLGAVPAE